MASNQRAAQPVSVTLARLAARALAMAVGAAMVFFFFGASAGGTNVETAIVTRVVDGDTFAVVGDAYPRDCGPTGQRRYCDTKIRVRNFDAAELRDAGCDEERALGEHAAAVAREILDGAEVTLVVDGEDRFGRPVADVLVHQSDDRIDFVAAMIARGAGARWRYGEEPQPEWCPRTALRQERQERQDRQDAEGWEIASRVRRWLAAVF